jgi:large subunit ribosomal protein L24
MIKKGDTVYIRTGSQKGKTGRVLAVYPKKKTVLVEGINKVHKHQRPTQKNQKGGIITREQPVHISNVALVVQTAEGPKPTRIKKKTIDEGGKKVKVRISQLTGEQI